MRTTQQATSNLSRQHGATCCLADSRKFSLRAAIVVAGTLTKQGARDAALTSLCLVYLRPSVVFDLWRQSGGHTGRCSHQHADIPNQRDVGDVLVALGATLAIELAKPGKTYTRMRMYSSAFVPWHRRSFFGLVTSAPSHCAAARGFEPHRKLHSQQYQTMSCFQAWYKCHERATTRDAHAVRRGEWRARPR